MKALVVEDVCMMRKLIEKLISPFGKCDTVENGREALIKFNQAWINDDKYDVIFLDLMLPEISGEDVLREIRELEKKLGVSKNDKAKIVICSALSDYEHVMKILEKQCDAYISKPFEKDMLYNTLKKLNLLSSENLKDTSSPDKEVEQN